MQNDIASLTVFYDGACPLCRKEIEWYKRKQGADRIHWENISETEREVLTPGLCKADALSRLHVRTADGNLLSGALAFAEIWKVLPNFRLIGKIVGLPVINRLAESLYRLFLKVRPVLQRCVKP